MEWRRGCRLPAACRHVVVQRAVQDCGAMVQATPELMAGGPKSTSLLNWRP